MDFVKLLTQRRLIAAVLAAFAAYLGASGLGEPELGATSELGGLLAGALGVSGAIGPVWSYFQRIEGGELYRRLWPAIGPLVVAVLGGLGYEVPQEAIASLGTEGTLALTASGLLGAFSYLLDRRMLRPEGTLASPNP